MPTKKHLPTRKILASCIALAIGSSYTYAQDDTTDSAIEEVVVTGSFIRGSPLMHRLRCRS